MPIVEVAPAVLKDLVQLSALNHQCESLYVWQMDSEIEHEQINVSFRQIRLPRSIRLEYPRKTNALADTWKTHDLFLVAKITGQAAGYLTLDLVNGQNTGRVFDLVVDEPYRRKGVATALLISAQDWLKAKNIKKINLEIQTRNHAAICLAKKMRYEFTGYLDEYFNNIDTAVFFTNKLR